MYSERGGGTPDSGGGGPAHRGCVGGREGDAAEPEVGRAGESRGTSLRLGAHSAALEMETCRNS